MHLEESLDRRSQWKAIAKTFSENVHRIRKEKGITQQDLAIGEVKSEKLKVKSAH